MTTATATVAVGDFFVSSWGYDQTNIDFYKVLKISPSGKTLTVQKWSSHAGSAGGGHVIPGTGPTTFPKWVDGQCVGEVNAPIRTKRLASWSDRPAFSVASYANAYLWDGRAKYETPLGAGH